MKIIISLFVLSIIVSCQRKNMTFEQAITQTKVVEDTNYISEQDALGYWLLMQPQQVRDDFKNDFTFSKKEIKEFIDTLKHISDTLNLKNN